MATPLALDQIFGVQGKRVIVTGGGTGIGRMIAEGFAQNGATVYIVGRRKEKLDEVVQAHSGKGKIVAILGDVSNKNTISKLVEAFKETGNSSLDVLVNCAGIYRQFDDSYQPQNADAMAEFLWNIPESDFSDSFAMNTTSLFYTTAAFAPFLRRTTKPADGAESPCVINITSIAGAQQNCNREQAVCYQICKAAATSLTRNLAAKLIPLNIRVVGIAPGLFPSEMTLREGEWPAKLVHSVNTIPEGRPGTPQDAAGTAIWLASRAGAFYNGETVVLDGGRLMTISALIGGSL